MFEYYLPGVDHRLLSDDEFSQKFAHLQHIREKEAAKSLQLATLGLNTKRKR